MSESDGVCTRVFVSLAVKVIDEEAEADFTCEMENVSLAVVETDEERSTEME